MTIWYAVCKVQVPQIFQKNPSKYQVYKDESNALDIVNEIWSKCSGVVRSGSTGSWEQLNFWNESNKVCIMPTTSVPTKTNLCT